MSAVIETEIPVLVLANPHTSSPKSRTSRYVIHIDNELTSIPRQSIETEIPNLISTPRNVDIYSSPDSRPLRHSSSIDELRPESLLIPSQPGDGTSIVHQSQNIEFSSLIRIAGYSPLRTMLYLYLISGIVILVIAIMDGLIPQGKFDRNLSDYKFKDHLWVLIVSNFVGGISGGYTFIYVAYLCIDKIRRPSYLVLFGSMVVMGSMSIITTLMMSFIAIHPFPFFVLIGSSASLLWIITVSTCLVARYDPPKYKSMAKFLIVSSLGYYYCVAFLSLFYSVDSNLIHALLLIFFPICQAVVRECIRYLVPASFPISIRIVLPHFASLFGEFFTAAVFPNLDSIYIFLLVFIIQISTNFFQPLIIRRDCWEIKQKIKNYLGIIGQYPNQKYEDYVYRASNDYIFTLFAQLTSHIVFLGMFLSIYHGFNADHYPFNSVYVSNYSYKLTVSFTGIQIFGITIQVLLARILVLKFYKHDPFRLCYYLLKTDLLLFFLVTLFAQFAVMIVITFDNYILYYFL